MVDHRKLRSFRGSVVGDPSRPGYPARLHGSSSTNPKAFFAGRLSILKKALGYRPSSSWPARLRKQALVTGTGTPSRNRLGPGPAKGGAGASSADRAEAS
jgi:hypothetical protein